MPSRIQSIIFSKKLLTVPTAKLWLRHYNYKSNKIDITNNYIRFRQFEPNNNNMHRTINITDGVTAIIEF